MEYNDRIKIPKHLGRYLFSRPLMRIISQPNGIAPLLAESVYQKIDKAIEAGKEAIPTQIKEIEDLFKIQLPPEKKNFLFARIETCSYYNLCFSTDRYFNDTFAPEIIRAQIASFDDEPEIKEVEEELFKKGIITPEMPYKDVKSRIRLECQNNRVSVESSQIQRLQPSETEELLENLQEKIEEIINIIKRLHVNPGEKYFVIKKADSKKANKQSLAKKKDSFRAGWPDALLCNTDLDMVIEEDNLNFYDRFCMSNKANPLIDLMERIKTDREKALRAVGFRGGKKYIYDRDFLVWMTAETFEYTTGKKWSSKAIPGIKEFAKILMPNIDMEARINSAITVKLRESKEVIIST